MNLFQRAAAAALDAAEGFLVSHERQHPLQKPPTLAFRSPETCPPVNEQPVRRNLPVVGKIPDSIKECTCETELTRFTSRRDGHAVKFEDGSASYACRFTQTNRFIQERQLGRPVFPKAIGELHGHTGIARLMLFYARAAAV
ncbi:hypothetical protein Rs2_44231 [Raphanus sativus]|nr:hypothetical protein Rs2_44231 [Raphanus sativus]